VRGESPSTRTTQWWKGFSHRAILLNRAIVKRTAPSRTICLCFFLSAACRTWCQEGPSIDLLRGLQSVGSHSAQVRLQEIGRWRSLPDAPSSVQGSTQALKSHTLVNEASAARLRATGLIPITPELPFRSFVEHYQGSLIQPKPGPLLVKYLYPSVLGGGRLYQPSTSVSLMGRTSYAASRIFVTREGSGKARLNTPYLLGLLASVAVHSTSHRNLARSTLATFNSFGSTVGSDAGINVFHEFEPGIRQIMKGHTPKFVSRVEDHFRAK
jgi:hypothetical protein